MYCRGMREHDVVLQQGTVYVRETGSGPPVVFVHGVLVDGRLWDPVVEQLAGAGVRCVVPDLPLGAHRTPMRADADLSPVGVARLVADLLEALDLEDVTLVGNDSGGAISQLVAARHPERLGRVVLTNCDAFEVFPPAYFKPLFWAIGHVPGVAWEAGQMMRARFLRHGPLGYGPLVETPLDAELTASWAEALRGDAGVRRDLRKLIRGVRPGLMVETAVALRTFDKPVRVVWGTADPFFKLELGRRLAAAIPGATLEEVDGARAFVPLDRPERVAGAIRKVVPQPATA